MGSLYTALISKLLFPLHERLKRHDSVVLRRAMEQSQWWTAEQLRAHQVQQLRVLLQAVGTDVPFYRALFSRIGFDPAATQSLADLQRLPLLDKAAIRANTVDMKRTGAADLARFNTGGSSGEPLIFFIGKARVSHDV
ncbi:MAG: phenylacetate--CoA ligase family protein, partial [Burkholderiales bacterium]